MSRRPGLDLLRAVAIVWVMVFHSYLAGWTGGGVLRWSGWMGVDLFFALSGFLIGSQVFAPLAAGRQLDLTDFYLRRSFRTLPAYLVVLAVYVVWPSMREAPTMMPLWRFLTYTMNLGVDLNRPAFSHAWSLCVEEQFYLLFPALALMLAWRARSWRVALVFAALVLGGMTLRAALWWHYVAPVQAAGGNAGAPYMRYLYDPTWARLDDLVAGVGLAALRSYRSRGWAWLERHANAVAVVGVLITLACMVLFDGRRIDVVPNVFGYPLLALGMAALVAAAAAGRGVLAQLRVPGAQWLALVSYSLYLSHKMVYGQLHGRLAPWVQGHGVFTVLMEAAAVLLVGAALHYSIERPFLRLREHVRHRRAQHLHLRAGASPALSGTQV
ncbi:acyltransferase [Oleiagrimonas sp. C23AA]|uniref:acyltransferase family protein n=1 Tax=Oleiagrimonas sp. C23AA TaxID=2719047 RepID=UPI001421AEA2|nr:acyltransferase [Oleiagrimonas sp. C23AA]NII12235.1 acyltransferase [Oleiagrimonas sp. C23AA]